MANHISSEKRARSSERKRAGNKTYMSSVKTSVKKFKTAVEELRTGAVKEGAALTELLRDAQSMLAKAAAKGVLKKNNATRRIGRLAKSMKVAMETSATPGAATKTATKGKTTRRTGAAAAKKKSVAKKKK